MTKLKKGDIIYIKSFLDDDPEFYCWKHLKDLIGIPTQITFVNHNNGIIYITHPFYDKVPFNEGCVNYEVVSDYEEGEHKDIKSSQKDILSLIQKDLSDKDKDFVTDYIFKKKLKENEEERKKSNKEEKFLDIINDIENGDLDVEVFGGIEKFLDIIKEEDMLHLINPDAQVWSDYQNQLFYAFYQNDTSFIWKIVDKYLSDVVKIGDDYYFDTSTGDLAGFFDTNYRSEISRTGIESILSGEHDMNFYDVTDDVYRDVYDELTNENKQLVKERIALDLKDIKTISTDTELLEEIAQEQGRENVELTDEVISRILGDNDTLEYLINKELDLDGVRSELYSLYSNCYSGILSDEWYDSLMNELVGFVIDNDKSDEYSYKKQVWDKDSNRVEKTFYGTRYKVTNCIYDVVSEWLEENKNCEGGYCDTIEYFGSYDRLLSDLIDDGVRELLRVPRLDDYPDHRKVNSCVNGNIGEYF
jgi:hypothetical protein